MQKSLRQKFLRRGYQMNKRVISFIKDFLEISASIIFIFTILTIAFGENARNISSFFQLGSAGIAVESLLQLFAFVFFICLFKLIFLTDLFFNSLKGFVRYILFFTLVTVVLLILACCFKWISNELEYWTVFLSSYAFSTIVSTIVSNLINKNEDKKLNDAIKIIKENPNNMNM